MVWAAHWLHGKLMSFAGINVEQFVLELSPVSAGLVQIFFGDVRRDDLLEASSITQFLHEPIQFVFKHRAARCP